jgi:hypothetical protein
VILFIALIYSFLFSRVKIENKAKPLPRSLFPPAPGTALLSAHFSQIFTDIRHRFH